MLIRGRTCVGLLPHVEASDARRAGRGHQQRREDLDERGLAGAVRAEQPEEFAAAAPTASRRRGRRAAVVALSAPGL